MVGRLKFLLKRSLFWGHVNFQGGTSSSACSLKFGTSAWIEVTSGAAERHGKTFD